MKCIFDYVSPSKFDFFNTGGEKSLLIKPSLFTRHVHLRMTAKISSTRTELESVGEKLSENYGNGMIDGFGDEWLV